MELSTAYSVSKMPYSPMNYQQNDVGNFFVWCTFVICKFIGDYIIKGMINELYITDDMFFDD
jgi:hypothetical protein